VAPGSQLGLVLPGPAEGLPQISALFHRATRAGDAQAQLWGLPPQRSQSGVEMWYREGWVLRSPQVLVELALRRRQGQEADKAEDIVALEVAARMQSELMSIRLANVSQTGTAWKVAVGPWGFSLQLRSFASNAASSFKKVLSELSGSLEAGPAAAQRLRRVKADFAKELEDRTEAVLRVAVREREILLTPGSHSRSELLLALRGLNRSASAAAATLRAARSGELSATGLVMGGCSHEDAAALQASILGDLGVHSDKVQLVSSNESERVRRVVRPARPVELRARSPRGDGTHVMLMSILVGVGSLRQRVLLGLISQVLQEVAFAELRTRLQLGYTVGGSVSAISNVLTISCFVQSEVALPDLAEAHCDQVLSVLVPSALEQLSSGDFANIKESFRLALLQPPLSPSEEMEHFWAPILLGRCFSASEQMLAYLPSVEKSHVLAAWKAAVDAKARTKVVVKLFGGGQDPGDAGGNATVAALQKVGAPGALQRRAERERRRTAVLLGQANSTVRQHLLSLPSAGFYPQTLSCDVAVESEADEAGEEDFSKTSSLLRRQGRHAKGATSITS